MFGKRNLRPVPVRNDDAPAHVFMIHYVEHDKVIVCNAPTIHRAVTWAQQHMYVVSNDRVPCVRPMYYDDDRICVMLYGTGARYTCNVMRMDVHDHMMPAHITLAA